MNNLLEYVVIGTYLVFLMAIGFVFKRFNSNVSDYFKNGCKGTWWLVGSSSFMAGISAYTFTGASGVAFEAGWSVLIIYLGNALGFLVNYLWFAKRFRQIRVTTGPEVVKLRFNKFTEQFNAWFALPMGILSCGLILYSLSIFSSSVFGFNIQSTIVVLGLVMMVYSVTGGSWAVMATDFIQCLVMLSMTLLLTGICLYKIGGVGGLFEQIAQQGLASDYSIINSPERFNRSFTWGWAIAIFIRQASMFNSMEAAPRYFSVKDGQGARKAALLAMVLMLIGACIWFIPPITARLLFEGSVNAMDISKPAESAFAVVSMNFLPPGMVGLMVVAMFAASMSTMDTGLNKNAAIFIKNIYPAMKKIFHFPEMSHEKMLFMSQVFSFIFGILGILCALSFAAAEGMGQFELVLLIGAQLGIPISVPLFLGLIFRKTTQWAAVSSILFGMVASVSVYLKPDLFGSPMLYQDKVCLIMTAAGIGFFITMPFAKKNSAAYREQVDRFFVTMNTPIDFEKEVGEANDLSQLKIIGRFTQLIGVFVCALAIIGRTPLAVGAPLIVGGALFAMGALMVFLGRERLQENPGELPEVDAADTAAP